ncbi:MAG: hypothetical protein AAGF55_16525 [Pseudomonadota bacterium]
MSDFARLEDKLAKLRHRERAPGEGRKLRGATADALLAAIVGEIDETILPRRLSFALESGTAVHLAAANRKLQAVLSPAPEGLSADLCDKELGDLDDPAVVAIAAGLRTVLAEGGTLTMSSVRPKNLFASDIGIQTSQLRKVWEIAEQDVSPPKKDPDEILSGFLASLSDDVLAWLRIEGEAVTDQGGDARAATELGDTAAVFLDGYFRKFEEAFPEPSLACATLISPAQSGASALFFVEIGDFSAIIAAKTEHVVSVAARWQSLVAE